MPGWARSTAASTSLSWSSSNPAERTATTSSSASLAATAAMFGITLDQRTPFRSAHLPSFRAKNRFRPSAGQSAGTEDRPAPRWPDRCAAAFENNCSPVPQLLLPVVDLVRMDPELTRQLGDRSVPRDRRQRHLRFERRVVLLPYPLHVLLLRCRAF